MKRHRRDLIDAISIAQSVPITRARRQLTTLLGASAQTATIRSHRSVLT